MTVSMQLQRALNTPDDEYVLSSETIGHLKNV